MLTLSEIEGEASGLIKKEILRLRLRMTHIVCLVMNHWRFIAGY